jgi:asparagine synthase (glutamine-hydrolysing)
VYRYFAVVWNPADEPSRLAAQVWTQRFTASSSGWSRVLDCDGVTVWHEERQSGSSRAVPLANSAGVVLGRILSRDIDSPESAARVSFDEAESAQVVASRGRRLLERYWGRYVAIVRDGASGEVSVLRDPMGGFPCWLISHDGVSILCSDIEDCMATGMRPFTVNWNYIAGFVAYAILQIRETALNEVAEVQPGERVSFRAGRMDRALEWSPVEIGRGSPLESAEEAVSSLRAATIGCVHTWAACYSGILHNLSGGLDSSIVLSCLATAPTRPELVCLNYFGTGPNEDERRYARAMAERVGVRLLERQLDSREVRLERLTSLRPAPRPWFYLYELEHGAYEGELACQHGAGGLFSGSGGDGVFFQARAELAVTDYLFAHGLGRGLFGTAVDAARVSRRSIWPLLAQALRARLFGPRWDPIALAKPLTRTVVNAELVASVRQNRQLVHPWFTPEAVRGVAPGILWHSMAVSVPPAYYSSFTRDLYPERTMPLLSQPLVEVCLRIPTYVLIESGWDRALARRAFERDLPPEIVRRRAKGRADQHVRNILDQNLSFVREMLLDGLLVQRGFLDRKALETYLTRERSPADFQYGEILQEHLCTEVWLRDWVTRSCATAG